MAIHRYSLAIFLLGIAFSSALVHRLRANNEELHVVQDRVYRPEGLSRRGPGRPGGHGRPERPQGPEGAGGHGGTGGHEGPGGEGGPGFPQISMDDETCISMCEKLQTLVDMTGNVTAGEVGSMIDMPVPSEMMFIFFACDTNTEDSSEEDSSESEESSESSESSESQESSESSESSESEESSESTESSTSPDTLQSTDSSTSLETSESTESSGSPETLASTESSTSPETLQSTDSSTSLETSESTESSGSPETSESSESSGSPETSESTESSGSPETSESTESSGSPETLASTESSTSQETSTEPSQTTQDQLTTALRSLNMLRIKQQESLDGFYGACATYNRMMTFQPIRRIVDNTIASDKTGNLESIHNKCQRKMNGDSEDSEAIEEMVMRMMERKRPGGHGQGGHGQGGHGQGGDRPEGPGQFCRFMGFLAGTMGTESNMADISDESSALLVDMAACVCGIDLEQ